MHSVKEFSLAAQESMRDFTELVERYYLNLLQKPSFASIFLNLFLFTVLLLLIPAITISLFSV